MFIKQSRVPASSNNTLHDSSHFFIKISSIGSQIVMEIKDVSIIREDIQLAIGGRLNKNDGG